MCHRYRGQGVQNVVTPGRCKRKFPNGFAVVRDTKSHPASVNRTSLATQSFPPKSQMSPRGKTPFPHPPQSRPRLLRVSPNYNSPATRHQIHQPLKRQLVRRKSR